jgi:hypothetical protein
MPQYLLTMIQPVGIVPGPDVLGPVMQKLGEFQQELTAKGSWVFAGGLAQPSSTTVLKKEGEEILVIDGPYAESKEFLGGITVIDVADLDEALAWGKKYVEATGLTAEVRPFLGR